MNYFVLFDIVPDFDVDFQKIKTTYFILQKKFHPDRARNNIERLEFLKLSIDINNAYKILIDNLARAEYILKLNDINLNDETDTNLSKIVEPTILMEALEEQELLENFDDLNDLQNLKNSKDSKTISLLHVLKQLFAEQCYTDAAKKTVELKYHLKLLTNIQAKINQKLYATSSNY